MHSTAAGEFLKIRRRTNRRQASNNLFVRFLWERENKNKENICILEYKTARVSHTIIGIYIPTYAITRPESERYSRRKASGNKNGEALI